MWRWSMPAPTWRGPAGCAACWVPAIASGAVATARAAAGALLPESSSSVSASALPPITAARAAPSGLPIATALGTNKLAAVFGTASAAWRYVRHVRIDLRRLIPVFVAALAFSALGATVAVVLPTEIFTPIVLVMLVGVGLFVALNPGFGTDASTGPRSRVSTIDFACWPPVIADGRRASRLCEQ